MAQLIIDNLDDRTLEILRLKARLHGRTIEEEARNILSGGTKLTNAERLAAAREIAAMTPFPQKTDSLDLLREDRDR
jgi:plasmid stability protein